MAAAPRPYRDKWGHRHTQAVFDHWTPGTIAALGIYRARRTSAEIAEDEAVSARARLRGSK